MSRTSGFLGFLDFHVAYISKVNINLFQVAMQTTAKVSRLVGTRPIELGTSWAIYFQGGRISLLRSMYSTLQIKRLRNKLLVRMGCPTTTTTTTTRQQLYQKQQLQQQDQTNKRKNNNKPPRWDSGACSQRCKRMAGAGRAGQAGDVRWNLQNQPP